MERVFSSSGKYWDGTYHGKHQPAGSYIWVVKYANLLTGKESTATGTVVLVR